MKKIRYGTTALVAAGLAAGQADAASGLKLGITGFYRGAMGINVGGDTPLLVQGPGITTAIGLYGDGGRTSGGFRQEIRLNFTGETTLDNGLTVGVLVGLNGENLINVGSKTTPQKQSWVDFKGKFGDVRFGEYTDAMTTDCIVDPGNVTANFGINSPNESFNNAAFSKTASGANKVVGIAPMGSVGTCYGLEGRGTKVGYFSPVFGGFTFGVTYAPSGNTRNPGGGYFYGTDFQGGLKNVLAFGFDYSHDFGGGFSLTAGGGGEWALETQTSFGGSAGNKPSQYLLGFQLGLPGGFTIGASGQYTDNYKWAYGSPNASFTDNQWTVTAGASYTVDAVSVGLQGLYSEWDVTPVGVVTGTDKVYGVALTGAYALGPGINLEAEVAYEKYDSATNVAAFNTATGYTSAADYDAVTIAGGFAINF
jgi:outer membrane protein OmpU